jgi:nucleoside-diphosphate-sugar epimerase
MIVGNGLVATAFRPWFAKDAGRLVFASGVSNSRETRAEEFARERALLEPHIGRDALLLYFSTCSINDRELADSGYVVHKKAMEALVREADRYAIFRLPQVVGRTRNPNTLTNYLHQKVSTGEPFQVWRNARRNLIDVDDVASMARHLLADGYAEGKTIDLASPFYISIPELVRIFEAVLRRSANYNITDAGGAYPIETSVSVEAARSCGVRFDRSYVRLLVDKYYGSDAAWNTP